MRREEEDDQREYDVVVCKEFEMCAFKAMYECGRWFVRKRENEHKLQKMFSERSERTSMD